MAATKITQYGEWIFANDNWSCSIGWAEWRTQFTTSPVITPRAGSYPKISQGSLSERTIQVTFKYDVAGAPADRSGVADVARSPRSARSLAAEIGRNCV